MGGFFNVRVFPGEMEAICSSFLLPSILCRPSLLPSALALACGAWSICWRAMVRITPVPMLMYGKVSQENYVELTAASAIPNKEIKSPQILRY